MPAHDPAALDVALSVCDTLHDQGILRELILNGDIADFYNVSLHDKMPYHTSITTSIKDEIYLVNKLLDYCQKKFKGTKITFIEGNHEDRLARYLFKKAPDLYELMDIESLFKLEERGIDFYPYGRHQLYQIEGTDLYVRHSPYSYSVHCAYANITKKMINLIHGCTHRYQELKIKTGDFRYLYGCSNACLIDFKNPIFDYMKTDNWSKGFSVCYVDGPWWQNNHVKIEGGRTVFTGYEFTGDPKFDFTR